ncbi:OmpH family outer membrane protein [Flavobacterium cerinum]|uniref:OmpH family outer membrane protein n=1 Tax=Flavobacterium cerinum TaxID=2502784 RepID=A0A444GN16_9FLAO|nr:OmpH family outer membrane protein [Flavobacterium cerinum]RWW92389.1 OmpH family outer membrane protein [Flavobacterium cerinum]
MKNPKILFITILFFAAAHQQAGAQAKIAHIDVSQLMAVMPEMKAAEIQIDKLSKTYDNEYAKMVEDFKTKVKKYDSEAATTKNVVKDARNTELTEMRTRIDQHKETAYKELQTRQEAIYKPIVEKARKAIQKVGKAKGYRYVIDSTLGTDVVLADGPDLLADVKKELGF